MKKLNVLFCFCLCSFGLFADGFPMSIGFQLGENAENFTLGLELSSPSFAGDFLSVRGETQVNFLSNAMFRGNDTLEWEPFVVNRLGLVGTGGFPLELIRLYGEFGGQLVLPHDDLSSHDLQWGIYGYFGFEFFMEQNLKAPVSYYLEAGSSSLFGEADKLPGSPDYLSGFSMQTGFRFYL